MTTLTATHTPTDVRDGYATVGNVTMHYVEAGEGPLVVLLHGFPEFWFGWRSQIAELADAGFRVVAPDMRGYNRSSRPAGVKNYGAADVADDVDGLIHALGAESAMVVGHDWGGTVAWTLEGGKCVKIEGGEEAERLRQAIDGVENATVIGEFAFGTSEKAPFGTPSEKGRIGTVHLALGDNHNAYPGGQNHCSLHLDGVFLNATLQIVDDGTYIVKDGKWAL